MDLKQSLATDLQESPDPLDIFEFLKGTRTGAGLKEEQLREIAQLSMVFNFNAGAVILQAGTLNSKLWFLVTGIVNVTFENEYIYSLKRRGDLFGESRGD